ncbi:MAG: hypothetical protein IT306_11685 [Chloroflexi bacterium]|nr:hypothetical protein [Chloroflexota bacterium]
MSWSDPEPTAEPRPAFRAGLSLVNAANPLFGPGPESPAEPTVTSLPFGMVGGASGGSTGRDAGGLGGPIGQRLRARLGQRMDESLKLLEQRFEQFGERPQTDDVPAGKVRPMVFSTFGGETDPKSATPAEPIEIQPPEPEVPAPPPIDYEAVKAAAWNEGFQRGYQEGTSLAAEEQKDTTIRLGALLHDIVADTEGFVRNLESEIVDLVLGVSEKVIGREARLDPQIVVNVVRSALNEIHDATEVRIRAHPDDVAILDLRWQEMLPRRVAERSELLADEAVERGGVVVETQIGYVDSQLKSRLQQIVNTFQAVLDGEPV